MYTSLFWRNIKNIIRSKHPKSLPFSSLVEKYSQDFDDDHESERKQRKRAHRRFAPCASSEPQNSKDMWLDKLKLPYYNAFSKVRPKSVSPEEEKTHAVLRMSPNPIPVGIGLTRENYMDEKLAKLVKEYIAQREANVKLMKTQILSGRDPDERRPEVDAEDNDEKLKDATEDDDKNKPKPPRDTRILRAV